MARFPGSGFPQQPRPLYNRNDPTLLSTWMRQNLERGAAAQRKLETTIDSLSTPASPPARKAKELQNLKRQLVELLEQPVRLSAEDVRHLQAAIRAAYDAIPQDSPKGQRARAALVQWHSYLSRALKGSSPLVP